MNHITLGFVIVWARQLNVFRACAAARGERAQARECVAGVNARFTEGFDTADQGQSIGMRQEPLDLGRREAFAIERHFDPEVEQRIRPQL
jgi:hypothetical protein